MRIIGLTGGTGSGKGFVSSMLKKEAHMSWILT